jgi:hypothetical protein
MTAKITADATGTKVNIGNAAEDALQIDSTAKTIKALAPYALEGNEPVPAFRAKRSSDLALTSASWTVVPFPTEELDTDNWYDPTTGKFTPQKAGWYQFNAQVAINGTSVTIIGVAVWKNGSTSEGGTYRAGSASTGGQIANATGLAYLNGTTDYISAHVLVTGTSPKVEGTLASLFSAFLVRTP